MKKLFSTLMLVLVALTVQAQILQPVKWKIQLNDSGSAEKEIVFTATADKGWHLYDQDLPEGGPVSTSFTFETLKGAELIGKPTSSVKPTRSEEHTSELQSHHDRVCRLLLEKRVGSWGGGGGADLLGGGGGGC